MERLYGLAPDGERPRWRRVGHDVYRTVGGYVTGNLLISLIAGVTLGDRALGCRRAVRGGARPARRAARPDPARGRDDRGGRLVLVAIAASGATAAIIVGVFFIVYQQVENHVHPAARLRPDGAALAARGARLGAHRGRARRRARRTGGDPGRGRAPGRPVRLAARAGRVETATRRRLASDYGSQRSSFRRMRRGVAKPILW